MSSAQQDPAGLSYYQTSPVRGQLEPYESQSRQGWRYLQCTDTPNELKVLLPPKTAHLYSQLLHHEKSELERGRRADWDRIVHIRHLKDRMIRKCQRLSRMAHSAGTVPAAFRIVHAPPDFRLKEMERWLRDQEPRGKSSKEARRQPSVETINTQSQTSHPPYAHAQTPSRPPRAPRAPTSSASAQRASSSRVPNTLRRQGSGSTRSSNYASTDSLRQGLLTTHAQALPSMHPFLSPVAEEQPESPPTVGVLPNPFGDTPQQGGGESAFASPEAAREAVVSPDPLPHLYRPPSLHAPMSEMASAMMEGPEPVMVPPLPQINIVPFQGEPVPLSMPEPVLDPGQPMAGPSRPLLRRRSSLRQGRSSANGTPKVVSWAMDRDWADHLTKFDHMVYAAEFASSELEEARKKFQEEISGVQNLRMTLAGALERLRIESDTLQREESVLKDHEERMLTCFERLKEKEARYKEKVQAVVDESKRAVIAADNKRESAAPS
jgi:FtsZ-binding cell division protein ZapB